MAAKDEPPREIADLVSQESSRPERAAAQLCQLKLRFEFSQQSSSTPPAMPAANAKRRLDVSTSPLSSGPCSPSVEALLASTVSRVESAVANELDAVSTTTKQPEKESMATEVAVPTPKSRSRDVASATHPKKQPQEINAKGASPILLDSLNVQPVGRSSPNGTGFDTLVASNGPATSTTVICKLTPDPKPASLVISKTPAKQAKSMSQSSDAQTPHSSASTHNGIRIVHGVPLEMPIVYIDDYMNIDHAKEKDSETSKPCSAPASSKARSLDGDHETVTSKNVELEVTPNITRSLKRLSEDDLIESTPKKQSTLTLKRKEQDCPVLSPVMRDSIDSPGSPMTRSMSRRIEEITTVMGDPSACKPVIPVNVTCGNASSSENEESILSLRKSFYQKKVQFSKVSLYLFEREQGFTSVPSEGGSTLGMGAQHLELQEYSIEEYAQLRRSQMSLSTGASLPQGQDVEGLIVQPVPTRRRRELLRQSGVRNIDALEKEELQMIRVSRQQCGCSCVGQCLPGSCMCLEQGIECQVDHGFYPCGCTVEGCSNPLGRHEFNRRKVKVHVKATCTRANRELGLPDVFEDIITSADSPDNFGSQEEHYSSSECSENSDYSSPEETLIEESESKPKPNPESASNGLDPRESPSELPISVESNTRVENAAGTSMS